jgi:amino acid adenylation domain-containing protein
LQTPYGTPDPPSARQRLLEWNDTRRVYEGPLCLHELIEEQAGRTPDRVAVTFEGTSLTYRELMERTARLARCLGRLGVGPEVRVGVCAERSLEMVVGLLGVLRAGGAYVPLDPDHPPDRLAYMVEDAAAPVVLTQSRLASLLPPHGARMVVLDDPGGIEDGADPLPAVPPDALAYVIYTSGSTGRPKGAMNAHRAVRNRLLWMRDDFGLGPHDVVLHKTPFSFDISVWEIFATLAVGARLVVAKPGGHQDPSYLVELIAREGITVAHFVPSMLRAFLGAPGLARCTALRRVLCSGEAVSADLEQRFFERFGPGAPELHNLYGPTEAAIEVTWWQCGPGRSGPVPIGRPLPNTSIHLLGPDLEPVAPGEEGELHLGGVQPARGYHGRPDLTAERFLPDPFASAPGSRLYRTGDLARHRPDGAIEFLGRIDHQVKLRGYRIELGEIETALGRHPAVHQAVVVARERNGEARLVAYVVPSGSPDSGLRAHLAASLPSYMIPAEWVFLEAFPLTTSGKVDRKALPEPERARPRHVPPCTALERFLAALWEETLGVAAVGRMDSFFDLGGTSLSGAVVVNRLQAEMGEILHVVALFDAPTLAKLAAYLGREHRAAVARIWGEESLAQEESGRAQPGRRVDEARLDELRRLVQPLAPYPADEPKNPRALFVLAPPRSGTTLLRVMLGGHPGLFSPPELELLTFNTLAERRAAFSGRDSFWREGVLRAVMELRGCGPEAAEALVEDGERAGWTTRRFYRWLQEQLGGRLLVDKSTSYPLDPEVLRRAEEAFEAPFYVHLVRHPYGMIHSFEEAKIDQLFFRRAHSFGRRELAELVWTASHRNVLAFLAGVPAERQHRLRFEDLVRDPEGELRRLCAALGLDYHPDMADPYQEKRARMTDGLHEQGRMLGDVKFHEHRGVDVEAAERWRQVYTADFLGEPTWETAAGFGYERRTPGITPAVRAPGEPLPLSAAQERLWFLDRMAPGSPVYNACRELRLHGMLDVPALGSALAAIVRRHEALRTVFRATAAGPVQVVLPPQAVPLPVADLSGLAGETRRAEARRVARETARLPFDLCQGPELRALLLRLAPEEHALRLDVHHIATDGWSMGVLRRELEALYRGGALPEPPVQYADYALWQRRWLGGEEAAVQMDAWRRRLAGLPPALELPLDRPRPPVQSFDGGLERAALPAELIDSLDGVGRRGGATLFMTLLAGFQALLQRLAGLDDLAVGIPSANRSRSEIEGLIGFFVNNLVIRVDLAGDPPFAEALGRVREAALFAYSHPDLPFERLVAELAPERDLSRPPVFQLVFSMQDAQPPLDLVGGVRGELLDVHTGTAKLDLWLQVEQVDGGWSARAEYATALFDGATVRRWLGHLRVLLAGIAADPGARLSDLPLLTAAEREQVLVEWNRTEEEIPDEPVHVLFRQWAERAPDALALSWEGGSLTYGELARRAGALAEDLRRQGVGPETVVALRLERSPELVTTALAVLAAGGAYLPIDPAQPEERQRWILEDSGAGVRAAGHGHDLGDESLAYVIYTSGSTGLPKGTELRHRGLANLIAWHRRTYGLGPGDRSTLLAGPGFDASVWETWAPLTAGASLHIPPPEVVPSPSALLAWMAGQGITVSFLPTPLAEAVLAEPMPEGLALRSLLTGGDRLRRRPAPDLPFALVNHYGPTESTVVATAGRVAPMAAMAAAGERAPEIGSPIANTRVYVLDRSLRPAPVGVPGELCLAGAGLARGYRKRPELTAERFVPDPFSRGGRLYRTGDLARWLPAGEIEFLGRVDQQVKIRGFRIEPGEVEAVLGRHPAVREAAVLERDGRLMACVVLRQESSRELLRDFLAARLPDPMVPGLWAFLEALPVTPNGKLDRRALASLEIGPGPQEGDAVPRTPAEELVAGLFARLLGLARPVGRHESFFHLGGHSLLVARLAVQVREACGVDLGLRAVFEHPTVAELAAWMVKSGRTSGEALVPAGREARDRDDRLPLSFAQQRLWFLESLRPGTPLYNLPQAWRLRGALSLPALAAALGAVVRRHEILRTVFPDGEPAQVVQPAGPLLLPVLDLSGLPPSARLAAAERALRDEVRQPFDLRQGPLFRTALLRLGAAEHHLALTMHHIVSDGWSVDVLARELSALYRAALEGRPALLAPLPIQYSDYAVWQRRWLAGEVLDRQLAWWRERLAGAPAVLELPTDRPRPAVASLRGATERLGLGTELGEGLAAVARRWDATLFMTLLAAFQALLHRYTGQDDLLVGAPVAGRERAELEPLVGFFVNLVPLRADLSGDPRLSRFLGAVRETTLEAVAHQEVPFERLVEELAPERDLSRAPLVQALLLFQEAPSLPDLPGVEASFLRVHSGTAKFDLTLNVEHGPGEWWAQVEYASDLFEPATARRLLGCFRTLLEGIAAGPEARLSDLPLLTPAERAELAAWNAGAQSGPEGLLHELFEERARRTPDALAVVAAGGERLTYRELERRSARLARRLRGMGVGPEVPVGVYLPRTAELVTALLGVLRSGGLYVPVDPAYPAERRAFVLEDSGCAVLISADGLVERLPRPRERAWTRPVPGNLAYLIYTSGSTGRPKGVAVEHRSAAALAHWARQAFSPAELAGVIACTSVAFDLSVFEIFVTLAWGGTVFLVENALAVPDFFVREALPAGVEPTLINTVPSAIDELLRMGGLPASVRTVNLAGEALQRALSDRVYARPETGRLVNLYGPSEDTTYSTWAQVERSGERPPAIGRPVHGTRAWVLDPWLHPLPVGVPGELCLAGAGLARGYLGRPELTAERFVPDPFAPFADRGERMYRTGDRVRLRPDGELEYLGRLDHQVKIRGFRVEPGEIEAVLARHPAVRQAAVLARDGRLAAWVALRGETSRQDLRAWLAQRLPEPMVPGLWAFPEALPLTPNGKVDRNALARAALPDEPAAAVDAPRNPVEELLAELFADVLGLNRAVGVREDFFHLGGHSLLAVRLASRARAIYGVDLGVRAVFEHPTPAALAERIAGTARASELPVPRLSTTAPLSFAQERLWFLDRFERGSAAYNLPVVFRLGGAGLRVDALAAALGEVVRRHQVLRTVFQEGTDGQPAQVVQSCAAFGLPVVDLAGLPDPQAEASRRESELARRPFDLTRGPLVRAALLRVGPGEHRLLLAMHHGISDGWSMGVLARELSAAYRAAPLPELPVQYADYAVWQRQWLSGEVLAAELAWWRERLAGLPPALELPVDRPRPPVQSYRGGVRRATLPASVAAALAALARRCGATFFMTALAALDALLFRLTGEEDLVVGAPVANRDRAEVEGLIGLFVNTLVLRVPLAGDPVVEELLVRVRTAALEAYAHQELPFEKLVAELSPERDLSRHPLFQVALSVQDGRAPRLELGPGLSAAMAEVRTPTSKFDLSLHLSRAEDGLRASFEYAADLFDATTVDRFLDHLGALLDSVAEGAAAGAGIRVSDLPLLTPKEREQLRAAWSGGEPVPPAVSTLHGLVEEQARRAPAAVAVEMDGRSLTYAGLVARAETLARGLSALGVGPETRVALCAGRSPEMVAGLLGILRSGGACVLLDPGHHSERSERLAWMLKDSGAAVLATTADLAPRLPGDLPRLLLDAAEIEAGPDCVPVLPEQLAYVIYTSGSTGRPKGVAVAHREAAAHCAAVIRAYGRVPGDRMLQFASPAFDVAVEEILPTLAAGATLVLRGAGPWDAEELAHRADGLGLTVLNLPTALWQHWAASVAALAAAPAALRLVIVGGEEVAPGPARQWLRSPLARVRLLNGYGPTEAVVTATLHEVEAGSLGEGASVPIGRPLPGRTARVLDRRGGALPVGVPGELYLGGCLARGYLGRPDLTAERFVPDPEGQGERLYRTGDLVRLRPDGALEFLRRIDNQVKLRGFRVEPAEIEAALAAHPAVAAAAVLVREAGRERQLVAFLEPAGPAPAAGDLRDFLASRLPAWMVPAAFVALERLPLTTSGKVDRAALARLPFELPGAGAGEAPRTGVERALAAIWEDVLGVAGVGRGDHFFHLGGHSLLAMRLASRVRARLGLELELRDVFEAPVLADLAERVERAQRAAVEETTEAAPAAAPLSPAQQRLWFLDRLHPGHPVYNLPVALDVAGPLAADRLERALTGIVRRHAVLRTTFAAGAGDPVQVVADPAPHRLAQEDLADRPADLARRLADRLMEEEERRPFDLERGPLLRALLIRLGSEEHRLALTLHHIVADGWSIDVLLRELRALYAGESLPELPLQYADYAVRQRRWLDGDGMQAQLAWWRERLAGGPPAVELPADRPRPAVQTLRGGIETLELPGGLAEALERLGRERGATLFMTLLAGFEALLHRYTGEEDLWVGTPVANRSRAELEGLVGLFVNTVVLRADAGGDPGFAELLARVREATLAAFARRDLPFERLVEELAPARDLSRSPLFQVFFSVPAAPVSRLELAPGVVLRPRPAATGTAKFDLSLFLWRSAEGRLVASAEHSSDLFEGATIRRLLGHLGTLLEAAVLAPEAPVSALPLLTEVEKAQLAAWDRAAHRGHPDRDLLHGLFEAQARRTPEAPAVVAGGEVVTYAGLEERSAELAGRLRALGAGPEVGVAVCLERSADLVVALLAVLRSGGFYVPLDPRHPAERLDYLLEDSGCALLITAGGPVEKLPPKAPPAAPPQPANLAYLIYTSGSTGRPKAVAIEHRSAVRLALWARDAFTPAERRGVLATTAVTFDLSVFEIFATLAWGGTVIVAKDALALPALARALPPGIEATLVNTVPSALAELLRQDGLPASVRTVNLAGEALPRALADRAYARPATERLYNLYGPSEDTTYSTWSRVERAGERSPAIGRPVDDTRAWVVDRRLERLPVGVPGELCLSGGGLARGYLGRPELTAERFVPDPLAGLPGERMYRTGDLARLRPDGELEYLGRLDHQVKVRGYRIEPGEVEAALARLPAVETAVVAASEDRLVAWVVPRGAAPAVPELRQALLRSLPEPLVPSTFVFLDALPLTPHGKVDRKALPAPDGARPEGEAAARWTPLEEEVAEIWKEVLGVERVGIHDSFWDLGGHSLLATRVLARLAGSFGVEVPLQALFSAPTVAGLANAVLAANGISSDVPLLTRAAHGSAAPLSFAQERLWFLDRLLPGTTTYNILCELRLCGPLDPAALAAGLEEVVRRHEPLRTRFQTVAGLPAQVVDPPARLVLPWVDLSGLPGVERRAESARVAVRERRRPFDLARGPMLRAALLRLGAEEHVLLLGVHHISFDAWSLDVLRRELGALYTAFAAGRPSPLASLPATYADFAAWQRRWLTGEVLETQLAHWRERLAGSTPRLELPFDRPRPAVQSSRGGLERAVFPRELLAGLASVGRRGGATMFITLLAGFQAFLHRITGQDDVLVGTPVANRQRPEVQGLIGFFVNTLVLRSDFAGDPTFAGLLARVRETTLQAYAHQDLPFERLVLELAPSRDLSHTPLFQVVLSWQPARPPAEELAPGLALEIVDASSSTAKFDLSLFLSERTDGLAVTAEYAADLFDAATVQRLLECFGVLLQGAAEAPETRISDLPGDLARWLPSGEIELLDLDHRALPAPGTMAEDAQFVPPRTPLEEEVAKVWREVLGAPRVGVADSFWDLGGHSLLATRALARLEDAFGVELPLQLLFSAPTLGRFAGAVGEAVLVLRAAGRFAAIPRRTASGPAPLSFAQQRLWLLDRLEPGSTAYNMPSPVRLRGALDVAALARALGEIVRRHEALRTTFLEEDGEVMQVIAPPAPCHLPVADLSGLPAAAQRAEELCLLSEALRPYDLERGPLFRAALVRLGERESMLLLDMCHIVSDGWSFGVFYRELGALYGAFRDRRPSPLPELAVQYADFVVWQRDWLRGPVLEEQLAWWRERLAGCPPALELPLDRPRPPVQTHRGANVALALPAGLTASLRELSRREGASLFMTLLAVFQLLLARLSGQDDVVVGSPSAGRSRVEIEELIGLFLNTLVLRTDLSGDPTFRELLGRARAGVLGAYHYQALPFERLLEELQPERQLSRTPIFQVLFNFLSLADLRLELPGLEVEPVRFDRPESKFDLTLYVQEQAESLHLNLVYNPDLFDAERMAEMLRQLVHLLEQAVASPDARAGAYTLVSPAAAAVLPDPAQPLSGAWQGAAHEALARHAALGPERVAVQDERGEAWTYAGLESRANRLASFLIDHGVEKGDAVAVWAHRGAPLVQALLGTLEAGAAFLILDPAYPPARLLDYLRIARPTAWVGVPGAPPPPPAVQEAVDALCRCRIELPAGLPEAGPPGVVVEPDDAACITFTSGSTGVPKGVVGRHGALTHFHPWLGERFGLGADDRFGMLSALAHDPLQRDVLTPLWFGARIAVPDPDAIGTPGYLAAWARRERVTVLNLTPAMLELLLDAAGQELPDLRLAFVVGDLLRKSDVERLQRLAPAVTCVNLYGATETQRALSWFEAPRPAGRLGKEVLLLGRGMEGCQLLVLDRAGRLAGVGELGEIHVRSRQLARGYLGDEELTAERFRPNPFIAVPEEGDRVYRTGDLGRYLPDGNVELAGRADFQVKLRGFRIELGEVEAALARFPGVRECVALVREDRPGERRLVAYLVMTGEAPEAGDLRAFLGERLPDYMVPSVFVTLPALPLTRTGKMDRLALPAPAEPAGEDAAPRNAVEEALATVWAEVLRRDRVGIHDNFFELGGDSIRTIQVVSRSRKHGLRLAPRQLFQHQTIAELAGVVEVERAAEGPAAGEPVPFTPAQRRLLAAREARREVVRIDLPAGVGAEEVERTLTALAARYDALRLRFGDGEQRLAPPGEAVIRLERESAGLEGGPEALRAALVEGNPAVLLLAAHPLALDAPSWGVLLADLVVMPGMPASPAVPFARWAAALAAEDVCPEPPVGAAVATVTMLLAGAETSALLDEALAAYGNTVEEVLLAALAGALASPRLVAEVEGLRPEREGLDHSGTVGCLAAPVRIGIEARSGPGDALKEIKERLRQALRPGGGAAGECDVSLRWWASLGMPSPWRAERLASPPGEVRRLRVDCRLQGGCLRADWASGGVHRQEDLARLAGRFLETLGELVRHCQSAEAGGFTPSDFPVSGLDQAELDQLLAELG